MNKPYVERTKCRTKVSDKIFRAAQEIKPLIDIIINQPKFDSLRDDEKRIEDKGIFAYPSRPVIKILEKCFNN